jgi:hypothetical protein
MDTDLIAGLKRLAKAERVPMAQIVRRALRIHLEDAGAVKPLAKTFGPTTRAHGRMRFDTLDDAQQSKRPGDQIQRTSTGGVRIVRPLKK